MLRFMKGSYKDTDLLKLLKILYEGSNAVFECNLECDQCLDAKVCKDVSELIAYLVELLPNAKKSAIVKKLTLDKTYTPAL